MRQVAQTPRDGSVSVVDVPEPVVAPGRLLVATRFSLISAGTERTKIETGQKNLVQKARARPDLVRKVVERARVEGVATSLAVARDRLNALAPIGYSASGVVIEVGPGVNGHAPGQRVACASEAANHAEILSVPEMLAAPIPDGVSFEAAAYATIGSIALHGVRQSEAALGEAIGVIGLGLVGQLAVRLLSAAGCAVVGIDLDDRAVELAGQRAIVLRRADPALAHRVDAATGGLGLDAVIVCTAGASPDPLRLAAELARDRARIVVVGEARIDVDRAMFYEKELELRMSRSYGPGRYDRDYEARGRDMPPGYVRWTERRNMEAFLTLVADGRIDPSELTTHVFAVDEARHAYDLLTGDAPDAERPFGVLLAYDESRPVSVASSPRAAAERATGDGVALVGAGAFARATLIPALKAHGARLAAVLSEGGLSAKDVADRFGFERAAGSFDEVIDDPGIGAVVIATRHQSHAELAAAALRAGKAVFVEKPLALTPDQLHIVEEALTPDALLMVGFNRRFAPLVVRLTELLGESTDTTALIRVNAGPLPRDHWLHDAEDGGGRLLGEGCHFVDLLTAILASEPVEVRATATAQTGRPIECSDTFSIQLRFPNGVGTVVYSGSGDTRFPKERVEVFGNGLSAAIDDFVRLELVQGGRRTVSKARQDKGHGTEVAAFLRATRGERDAVPGVNAYITSTKTTLAAAQSLRSGEPVSLRMSRA